jgi:hypothetical protein
VKEPLDSTWSEWFDDLAKIRNLNLTVISVARINGDAESWREKSRDE